MNKKYFERLAYCQFISFYRFYFESDEYENRWEIQDQIIMEYNLNA